MDFQSHHKGGGGWGATLGAGSRGVMKAAGGNLILFSMSVNWFLKVKLVVTNYYACIEDCIIRKTKSTLMQINMMYCYTYYVVVRSIVLRNTEPFICLILEILPSCSF